MLLSLFSKLDKSYRTVAKEDINNIIDFLAIQSEAYAKLQAQRIFSKIELLQNLPNLGRVVPELGDNKVREIIIGPYRIVYHIVSDKRIDVLTIHHSARPLDINEI